MNLNVNRLHQIAYISLRFLFLLASCATDDRAHTAMVWLFR